MAELDDIRALVEVLETGGFSSAAGRLGVSKSIVSRRVSRLEADLGTRLVTRTTRGIAATEAGQEFRARAARILRDLEEAQDAVARHGGEIVGCLRVSLPLSFGIRHVAPLLAELAMRHPRLEIEASFSDRLVDLIGERLDAAVRIGQLRDSSLVARQIAPARTVIVASPAYLARHGRPATPAELAGHQCLIYTAAATAEWRFQVGRRWVAVRPEGRLRSDSGDALLEAAVAGLGIGAFPTFLAGEAIRSGRLEPLLLDFPTPEYGIHVVRPPGAHVPGKLRVFIDLLAAHFSGDPHWDPCRSAARVRTPAPGMGQAEPGG